jgi:hypothetical protein
MARALKRKIVSMFFFSDVVNLLARFLILFKVGYTSFMLFVLSSFTYIIRLVLHKTTKKYLKPCIDAK